MQVKNMDETGKVSRIVRKKLERYFNREIIEREFDPSGTGLHTTTPLVARLELAYMTAVDRPFRNVHKSLPQKQSISCKQERTNSRVKDLTPRTQRDTKLKGKAQTKDILRLTKSSEDALSKISLQDVMDVHRYRSQGVKYEYLSKGKIPHVSHHVHAYLNSEEALRFSQEWDDRKLAQEYKAKRCADRKNRTKRNQANVTTSRYSPRSNTLIDFRNSPLILSSRDGDSSFNPVKNKDGKKLLPPTDNSDELVANQSPVPTDTDSQTSSVRRYYVRRDTGTLPGDTELTSMPIEVVEVQGTEKHSDLQQEAESNVSVVASPSQVANVLINLETHPESSLEENDFEVKENSSGQYLSSEENGSHSAGSAAQREDILTDCSEIYSPLSKDQNTPIAVDEQTSRDENATGFESRTSYSLSPRSISRHERKRPKTARRIRSTLRSSSDDVSALPLENESRDGASRKMDIGDGTPSGFSAVPDVEISDNADQRFGGSHTSIGDASSLLDDLSIKSLSLQDTFSGSYSLDFEDDDDDDDDGSSEFDNVSYSSRTRGRSHDGGGSPPNEETAGHTTMSVSPSNHSIRTEEYVRTESVVSLR